MACDLATMLPPDAKDKWPDKEDKERQASQGDYDPSVTIHGHVSTCPLAD